MSTWHRSLSLVMILLGNLTVATAAEVQVCFWANGRLHSVEREISQEPTPAAALAALTAGPTQAELAAGLTSALPPGTKITRLIADAQGLSVEFSPEVLSAGVTDMWLEALFTQVRWTLEPFNVGPTLRLTSAGVPLSDYLPPAPDIRPPSPDKSTPAHETKLMVTAGSALSGKKIALSPGHGLRWNGSMWNYERPAYCAPLNQEDLHNAELVAYLQTYLAQDGATNKTYRCVNKNFGDYSPGRPWWTMSAGYWVKYLGYPCSVYASITGECTLGGGLDDSSDSLRSRPLASDYDNTDIYVSIHTNGNTGNCYGSSCPNGTCTYYDAGTEHAPWGAVSQDLATKVNTSIISVIRNQYGDSTWQNRGVLDADGSYAETRIPDRAAILVELAFHDSCDRDALYLQDEFFRSATMWAVYKGVCDYFGTSPTYAFYSDEYVSDTIPAEMIPGQSYPVTVTFRNRGVLWNEARQFRLGAVDDSDPFIAANRVYLGSDVGPGQTYTFEFTMIAPSQHGTYTTDWRMVRDGVTWFGSTLSKQVQVSRTYARGDFNFDHDVDVEDFGHLQACYSGLGIAQTDPACQDARLDGDDDVDEYDFAIFQACLTGPNQFTTDPYCGD